MNTLKQIARYLLWTAVSIALGIGYMRIVLGPNEVSSDGLGYLLYLFYSFGLFHIGAIVGCIVAILFILVDIFYLKKKLKNNMKSIAIRFVSIVVITCVVGITHYILEKVVDVI